MKNGEGSDGVFPFLWIYSVVINKNSTFAKDWKKFFLISI